MDDKVDRYKSLLEDVTCNLCGKDKYDIVYPPNYDDAQPDDIEHTFRTSGDEILVDQLVRCRNCDLQYLTPRLRSDVILRGYSAGTDETWVSQVTARERTFNRSLERLERIITPPGRLLDIGTGGGPFLGVAKKRGWEVAGCEPNHWLADWGSKHYGFDIVPGTVYDMGLDDQSFDMVTLWDVLEHTPDPKGVLKECRRVLKPGGLLVVNYPDINSLIARLMGRKWVFLLSIHLYYFTIETITDMMFQAGFMVRSHNWHWQSLELGYILYRMKAYLPALASFGTRAADALGIQHSNIPYWMGQVLVLADPRP